MASCRKASNGIALSKMCFKSISSSIFIFQFVTATVIMLNASKFYMTVAGMLCTLAFLIYVFLFFSIISPFKKTEDNVLEKLVGNTYMHPIERMETLPKTIIVT